MLQSANRSLSKRKNRVDSLCLNSRFFQELRFILLKIIMHFFIKPHLRLSLFHSLHITFLSVFQNLPHTFCLQHLNLLLILMIPSHLLHPLILNTKLLYLFLLLFFNLCQSCFDIVKVHFLFFQQLIFLLNL